jgi:hypothetical protein
VEEIQKRRKPRFCEIWVKERLGITKEKEGKRIGLKRAPAA